ncbi:HNH endonuclease [Pseudomonas oryzihabitans]|uniref:HNH endonuclease n=1 Tax=Pseudomonas oryzihabitans TaxID=47885 RepID=UPI0009EE24E2|nr:HNH endonuclease domain-containing protein [Pseudomonas oryzihabitans]
MPTIKNPVVLSADSLAKIKEAKALPDYTHTTWSAVELESVRREIRNHYRREQRFVCAYCQERISIASAEACPVEHIVPKSVYLQFMFEPRNLCVICADCNHYKSKQEPLMPVPLDTKNKVKYPFLPKDYKCYHPHLDVYHEHIAKAKYIYLGLTNRGGFTILMCGLNRYVHQFGISDEFMADFRLIAEREAFHQTGAAP